MTTIEIAKHAAVRTKAIEDEVLIDVTKEARECGFLTPVAVSHGIYDRLLYNPDSPYPLDRIGAYQELFLQLVSAIEAARETRIGTLYFTMPAPDADGYWNSTADIKVVCGPDADGFACLSVMLAHENAL